VRRHHRKGQQRRRSLYEQHVTMHDVGDCELCLAPIRIIVADGYELTDHDRELRLCAACDGLLNAARAVRHGGHDRGHDETT